jgi:hypothetical protein
VAPGATTLTISQLTPSTPYDIVLIFSNGGGSVTSNPETFTTAGSSPSESFTITMDSGYPAIPYTGASGNIYYFLSTIGTDRMTVDATGYSVNYYGIGTGGVGGTDPIDGGGGGGGGQYREASLINGDYSFSINQGDDSNVVSIESTVFQYGGSGGSGAGGVGGSENDGGSATIPNGLPGNSLIVNSITLGTGGAGGIDGNTGSPGTGWGAGTGGINGASGGGGGGGGGLDINTLFTDTALPFPVPYTFVAGNGLTLYSGILVIVGTPLPSAITGLTVSYVGGEVGLSAGFYALFSIGSGTGATSWTATATPLEGNPIISTTPPVVYSTQYYMAIDLSFGITYTVTVSATNIAGTTTSAPYEFNGYTPPPPTTPVIGSQDANNSIYNVDSSTYNLVFSYSGGEGTGTNISWSATGGDPQDPQPNVIIDTPTAGKFTLYGSIFSLANTPYSNLILTVTDTDTGLSANSSPFTGITASTPFFNTKPSL